MRERAVILGVFAHPDDESYGPGGTLARYAIEGAAVHVLTFTCGEAGTIGVSKSLPARELCARREAELAAACEALGAAGHRVVGVPDGAVDRLPFEEGVAAVEEEIGRVRPDVIVTFHRLGVSGHPDHVAVTGFAAEAFRRAGQGGPAKLYEWSLPASAASSITGRQIVPAGDGEIAAILTIPEEAMERKIAAIHRHETQIEFYHELERIHGDYRKATAREYFVLAASRLPLPGAIEDDLLRGIVPAGEGR